MLPEGQIGTRVREVRKSRGVTLDTLAEDTGLTKGYLSKIENGRKLPPIATLSRISTALECDMTFFFEAEPTADALNGRVSVVRAAERKQVIRGGSSFGYDYESVAHKKPNKAMEPFVFTFPSQVQGDTYFEHDGEEMIFILSGSVEFEIADKRFLLSSGDCIYFESSLRHRGQSIGGEAKALVVIYHSTNDGADRASAG